jgi:hypothetical protein
MKRWLILLLLLGLAIRVGLAWLPVDVLIARTLPDDAFIYFVIARHLAAGLGATFDGLQSTNGFHPLWALLLTPIFKVFSSGDLPVHIALTLAAAFDTAAAGLSAWTVWRVTRSELAAPLALGFYLFNPRLIQESVNGLETGLALACLATSLAVWVWWQEELDQKKRAALFGLSAGLTFLARSDLVIIVGLLGLAVLIKMRTRFTNPLLAVGSAAVVVAPWLGWSQLRVGTLVQSSGVAIPSLVAARIQAGGDFGVLWDGILFPVINYGLRDSVIYPGIAILAAVLGVVFMRWSSHTSVIRSEAFQKIVPFAWPLAGALIIVIVHTVVRWYPRGWYFAPLAWAWVLVSGPLFAAGLTSPLGRRYGRFVGVLLSLILFGQALKMLAEPEYVWQSDMRTGADWLAGNTASDEVIGAFNAGIYAYYSERRVLSLDGLVDWSAIEARQQNRLLDYFVERGGDLIIDHQAYAESFATFFGSRELQAVETLPVANTDYGPITIYAVR